jgi:hypothetical protein
MRAENNAKEIGQIHTTVENKYTWVRVGKRKSSPGDDAKEKAN